MSPIARVTAVAWGPFGVQGPWHMSRCHPLKIGLHAPNTSKRALPYSLLGRVVLNFSALEGIEG